MPLFSLAIFTAIVFFIAVPTFFFLYSLIEYRKIRRIVIRSTSAQFLSEDMKKGDYCRLFGQFDGFKDDDEIWIQTDQALVKVKMRHGKVIFLPERVNEIPSGFFGVRIPGSLKILKWKKINNLEFKTKIFLFGEIQKADGVYVFDASDPKTLLVLYEGVPEDIDKELVVQSKNRYTYFQSPSLSALFIGSLMMCLISILEYQFSGRINARCPVFFVDKRNQRRKIGLFKFLFQKRFPGGFNLYVHTGSNQRVTLISKSFCQRLPVT